MSWEKKVTMIEDLPELEDEGPPRIKREGNGLTPEQEAKFRKAIREDHYPPVQSGMGRHPQPHPQPSQPEHYTQPIYEPVPTKPIEHFHGQPSCIEVAYHVRECPICSQFYKNDKTPYLIAIAILIIICILMLKKVLNV